VSSDGPEIGRGEVDGVEEVAWDLVVAGGNGAELLELCEEVLDQLPCLYRCIAAALEVTDHFHFARAGLGQGCCLPAEHSTSGSLGVEVVRLGILTTLPSAGSAYLVDGMACLVERARQTGPIRAGALDAEVADGPERSGPSVEFATTVGPDPYRQLSKPRDGHRGVGVLVGVEADDDVGEPGFAHVTCSPWTHCPGDRPVDKTVTGWTASGSYEVTPLEVQTCQTTLTT